MIDADLTHKITAISGLSSRDVGNPYIVYGISVNKLIYREQRDDKPDIAQVTLPHSSFF